MDGLDEVVQLLQRAERPSLPTADMRPIEPRDPPPVAAVDGSHAVLVDNGAYWVVAVRAGFVPWPGHAAPPRTRIHATLADQADAGYAARGLPEPRITSAESYADALRSLAELDACFDAIRALPEGGLLLVDGALAQLPPGPQAIADRIVDRATASGVHVAGISKRSGLQVDGVPIVAALHDAGSGRWVADVQHTRVACLHPAAPHAFRIDAEDAALPWLAALADDAVYRGYPYPLAKVHNQVTITGNEKRRLRERLHRAVGPEARAFDDFHAVLDRNVPR